LHEALSLPQDRSQHAADDLAPHLRADAACRRLDHCLHWRIAPAFRPEQSAQHATQRRVALGSRCILARGRGRSRHLSTFWFAKGTQLMLRQEKPLREKVLVKTLID
jgi:hypothetical protein